MIDIFHVTNLKIVHISATLLLVYLYVFIIFVECLNFAQNYILCLNLCSVSTLAIHIKMTIRRYYIKLQYFGTVRSIFYFFVKMSICINHIISKFTIRLNIPELT